MRPFARVRHDVPFQIAAKTELRRAVLAVVRLFLRVHSHVGVEPVPREGFFANRARLRPFSRVFYSFFMRDEVLERLERKTEKRKKLINGKSNRKMFPIKIIPYEFLNNI